MSCFNILFTLMEVTYLTVLSLLKFGNCVHIIFRHLLYVIYCKYFNVFCCRQVCTYSSMKKVVAQVLSSVETFVSEENFQHHIRPKAHNMENVNESLVMRRHDLERTDCTIIIAGMLKRDDRRRCLF